MDVLCSLSSNINSLARNKKNFVPWFISHKLISNNIPWFESGIQSTVALASLARRNTIANAVQSK